MAQPNRGHEGHAGQVTLTVEGNDDRAPTQHGKKGIVTHTDLKIRDALVRDEGRLAFETYGLSCQYQQRQHEWLNWERWRKQPREGGWIGVGPGGQGKKRKKGGE